MRERYVRPPLVGREPRSPALQVWPFRVAALIVLALVAWAFILLVKHLLNPEAQAPGIGAAPAVVSLTGRTTSPLESDSAGPR